jgi:hypothetical protein
MHSLKRVAQPQKQSIRRIPLTQGQFAIVDASDYDWLTQWKWNACWDPKGKRFYAKHPGPNDSQIAMHRELMHAQPNEKVDHIDRNGLNNVRSNLRICTHAQNCKNRTVSYTKKIGFKGVTRRRANGKWRVRITLDYKLIYIGDFDDEIAGALAYDQAALKYHGDFACLNFPHQ